VHGGGNQIRAGFVQGGLWWAQADPALFRGLNISVLSPGGFISRKDDKNSAFLPCAYVKWDLKWLQL